MNQQKTWALLLNKGKQRLAGMVSIQDKLDLGGGISVSAVTKATHEFSVTIDEYHKLKADLDRTHVRISTLSGQLRTLNQRILMGVGARFGGDSDAYQQVGGTRKSQHKKPARKNAGAGAGKKAQKLQAAASTPAPIQHASEQTATGGSNGVKASIGVSLAPSSNGVSNGTAAHG